MWNKENLIEIVSTSNSKADVLKKMGLRCAGGNWKTLNKYLQLYDIDYSHFKLQYNSTYKFELSSVLVENSNYSRFSLKKRLYKDGILERKCCLCGQDENWNGIKISLILDHINGVYNDNRIENLRIVCPNCNAGLDTFAGRNSKVEKIKYFCKCGGEKTKYGNMCVKCYSKSRRKVNRPSYDELIKNVSDIGYLATSRIYSVSDRTIKKWIKFYEKYE